MMLTHEGLAEILSLHLLAPMHTITVIFWPIIHTKGTCWAAGLVVELAFPLRKAEYFSAEGRVILKARFTAALSCCQ